MVNAIAPIFTEKGGRAIRQTTFYPFAMVAQNCIGLALKVFLKAPRLETGAYGNVNSVNLAATWNEEKGEASMIGVNISDKDLKLEVDMRSFGSVNWIEHRVMDGDLYATNTLEAPDRVLPKQKAVQKGAVSRPEAVLPAKSFHLMRFKVK